MLQNQVNYNEDVITAYANEIAQKNDIITEKDAKIAELNASVAEVQAALDAVRAEIESYLDKFGKVVINSRDVVPCCELPYTYITFHINF